VSNTDSRCGTNRRSAGTHNNSSSSNDADCSDNSTDIDDDVDDDVPNTTSSSACMREDDATGTYCTAHTLTMPYTTLASYCVAVLHVNRSTSVL
jgi:hypothetical protein